MGWRAKANQLKATATAGAKQARASERLAEIKIGAVASAKRLKNSDVVGDFDVAALKDAATRSSGLANRSGKFKRSRIARAAITPTSTAGKVAKDVGAEIVRQRRSQRTDRSLTRGTGAMSSDPLHDETTPRGET